MKLYPNEIILEKKKFNSFSCMYLAKDADLESAERLLKLFPEKPFNKVLNIITSTIEENSWIESILAK